MADRDHRSQPHTFYPAAPHHRHEGGPKSFLPRKGPTAAQLLAVATLLPVGGSLLGLAGVVLAGTLVCLALATPVFLICSPVLVPAAVMVAGAVTGILTSGAFGLTGLSSFSWMLNSFRQATGQQPLEYARQKVQDGMVQVGEKTKQAGEMIGDKTKHTGETIKSKAGQEGPTSGAARA